LLLPPGLLALSGLTVLTSAHPGELAAEPREIINGTIERRVLCIVLRVAHRAGRLPNLLPELLQVIGNGGFRRVREFGAPQLVRAALQAGAEIAFIGPIERAAQLAGSSWLCWREFARGGANLLRQAGKIVGHLLAAVDQLVDFLARGRRRLLAGGAGGVLAGDQPAYVVGLLFLLGGQLLGRLRHGVQPAGCVLLLGAAQQIGGFAEALGGAACIGGAGIAPDGAPDVLVRLT